MIPFPSGRDDTLESSEPDTDLLLWLSALLEDYVVLLKDYVLWLQ